MPGHSGRGGRGKVLNWAINWLPLAFVDQRLSISAKLRLRNSVVADPAFIRLLSFLEPEYKVPSCTQRASLLANRHQRAQEEMKCLLRAQATGGVVLTNDGSTWCTCDPIVCEARSSRSGSRVGAVERRSRNSSLQRETHSWELGRWFLGCSEKILAVDGPAGEVSETYHRNPRWSSQHGCCRHAQAPWWGRRMGKSTSFRPPYGLLGCSAVTRNSHMLRDVTYTFWSENGVQDCAVRPVAVAAGRRKVIRPVIMATGRRSKRSKVKGHVGTAIQHSYLGRNQAAPWPRRCAPRSGFAWSGPHPHAGLLINYGRQFLFTVCKCHWAQCPISQ